jgi:apolipoprotein N-acyltransferase
MYIGAYAAWVAWLTQRRAAHPALLAAGWLACEFARSHSALGSPWALTAYAHIDSTALIQIADLAGPYGIGMLVASINAVIAAVLVPPLRGRRPAVCVVDRPRSRWRSRLRRMAPPADLRRRPWRECRGGSRRRAAYRSGTTSARLTRYVALTKTGVTPDTGLVVWPEHAVEAYLEEATPTRDTLLNLSRDTHTDLILGGPHYESSPSGTRYHNSVYLVRDGRLAARYDKHRLVPLAEDDRFMARLGRRPSGYTPGDGGFVLASTPLRLGTVLCFEAMFPALVRQAVEQGAEVLVNLSNDAWFGDATAARQQLDIATLRAVENRRYLVRAAATGI